MAAGISTHVFLQQRLHHGLLDAMRLGGTRTIELFAARHHFDYTDRATVRDLADWFRSNDIAATLHQPLYADAHWSRHVAPTVNLIDVEKSRRIDAMDEVKRALEAAEQIPITAITLHLGQKDDTWSPRSLEHSLTAIEHLKAFAHPLGVKILLENLQNDVTTPEHLLEIIQVGHFTTVGICLDLGHAHLCGPLKSQGSSQSSDYETSSASNPETPHSSNLETSRNSDSHARSARSNRSGNSDSPIESDKPRSCIDQTFDLLRSRIAQLNLHDNHGQKDEHLWPAIGIPAGQGIDWKNVAYLLTTLKPEVPAILEIAHDLNETPDSVTKKSSDFLSTQSRLTDDLLQSNPA